MIRLYMDWNVMSQIKNGMHDDFYKAISNKEQFLLIYSTSHINDISSSYNNEEDQTDIINSDLLHISFLTDNFCAYHNGKDVVIEPYSPHAIFSQQINETALLNNFNLDSLFNSFGGVDDETDAVLKKGIEALRNIPVGEIFKEIFNNPVSKEHVEKLFPGLENNLSFEGLVNSSMKMFRGLTDSEDYKDLRLTLQKHLKINRDRLFNQDVPYKAIEEAHSKLGAELSFNEINNKSGPKWFDEITNNYLVLDMHGYQEDKIFIKNGKKATFRNTIDDAFHSAFASMCDFYITNDDRSYKKSKEVYSKLCLNTVIFKPNEFVDFYNNFLATNLFEHLRLLYHILSNPEFEQNEDDQSILKSFYFNHFLFDYFTRAHILIDKHSSDFQIFLSKDKPTNHKFIFRCELEKLLNKLNLIFGLDSEQKGDFAEKEIDENGNWSGRFWHFNSAIYRLVLYDGWIQLYIDLPTNS